MSNADFVDEPALVPRPIFPNRYGEGPRRMLVVEDDVDLFTVFVRIVRSLDPEAVVDWALSAEEAMKYLRRNSYDAVIADYLLPGTLNGLALRPQIRRRQPRAAFALMSAHPVLAANAAKGSRPYPFLSKPFTVVQCREFLGAVLFPTE